MRDSSMFAMRVLALQLLALPRIGQRWPHAVGNSYWL